MPAHRFCQCWQCCPRGIHYERMLSAPAKCWVSSWLLQWRSPALSGDTVTSSVKEKTPAGTWNVSFFSQEQNTGLLAKWLESITGLSWFLEMFSNVNTRCILCDHRLPWWTQYEGNVVYRQRRPPRDRWLPNVAPPSSKASTILSETTVSHHVCDPALWFPLQGAVSGSVQASDRLMKELREIYRSQSYKTGENNELYFRTAASSVIFTPHRYVELKRSALVPFTGIYSVELVSDSLYEWHVKLRT